MTAMHAKIGDAVKFSKTVGESDIYLFAGITGDLSQNHVDDEFMSHSIYGRRIAHGALMIGIHGWGMSTPWAAPVAAATCGFASERHMPKGGIFTTERKLITVATALPLAAATPGCRTRVEGEIPWLHFSAAP